MSCLPLPHQTLGPSDPTPGCTIVTLFETTILFLANHSLYKLDMNPVRYQISHWLIQSSYPGCKNYPSQTQNKTKQ